MNVCDESSYRDGLRKAEEIAVDTTDKFWNDEFSRHGNKGLCAMKSKLGYLIETAIQKEWKNAKITTGNGFSRK